MAAPGYNVQAYVDADRFAQMRYGETLKALLDPRVTADMAMQSQRYLLDEVTS